MSRLRTMPSRSLWFFPAVILGPFALAALVWFAVSPREVVHWSLVALAMVPVGLWSVFMAVQAACEAYFAGPEGIVRHGVFTRVVMKWEEMEAVGTRQLTERGIPVGRVISLYSSKRIIRPAFSIEEADGFLLVVHQHCPQAIRINEDLGTFNVSSAADADRVRHLVAQHARRLQHRHAIALLMCGLVLTPIPYALWNAFQAKNFSWSQGRLILVSLSVFVLFTWRHWTALWRLRR